MSRKLPKNERGTEFFGVQKGSKAVVPVRRKFYKGPATTIGMDRGLRAFVKVLHALHY